MLTCYCGSLLISNGEFFECPLAGTDYTFNKDKDTHKGLSIPDKRLTIQANQNGRRTDGN